MPERDDTAVDPVASPYTSDFYHEIGPVSLRSAEVVVPIVQALVGASSVVDVGCGNGAWLSVFRDAGVEDHLGLDGDHVQVSDLMIDPAQFRAVDLATLGGLEREFDLALSLEVAEHLDPSAAAGFVDLLTSLAPVVLFSAAIPGQGGVDHVNEQWPCYWADLFAARGYRSADVIRPRIWDEPAVAGYFAQNIVLYSTDDRFAAIAQRFATSMASEAAGTPLAIVHPEVFRAALDGRDRPRPPASLQSLVRQLPRAGRRALVHRVDRFTGAELRDRAAFGQFVRRKVTNLGIKVRRLVRHRILRQPYRRLPRTDWVRSETNPDPADVLGSFRFFAVMGTWYEADVVEATVRNAIRQGCERVYLVDNDSPDDTVERAVAAGAVLARTFRTDVYDEARRMQIMNEVVAEVSEACGAAGDEHVWWLWLDADEFHHGPSGLTLRAYLGTLDRRFRVVGARFFNHFPDRVPASIEGEHPIVHQPLCQEHGYPMCTEGHRKHPLQRWDHDAEPITCSAGFHQASSPTGQLVEPALPIFLHHFPYRDEAVSRRRLELLCDPTGRALDGDIASMDMHKRFRSFDAVYRGDWRHVDSNDPLGRVGVKPAPWSKLVPVSHALIALDLGDLGDLGDGD